jgi:RHS repeat-associated protein
VGLQIKSIDVSVSRRKWRTIYHCSKKKTEIDYPSVPAPFINQVTVLLQDILPGWTNWLSSDARTRQVTCFTILRFIYDGANILPARYTHWPGIDEPVAVTKGATTFFYHQDGLGSVTDLTDSAGATAKSYSYDAYGIILDSPGAVDQPYTYTGREFDQETGLYYYRARYYDAQIGKFTQRDPIGRVGGNNYYEYALGDPTLHFDPFGLKAQVVIWAPVGIGTSSFGHVSTNINGTTYSFGPNGMTNEPTPVFDQRNSFRSSLGLDLNLTVEQEKALDECLKRDQPEYNFLTNNCGAPVQRCLNWMGYDIGQVLTPAQLYESMTGVGLVGGTIFYPGAATKPVQSK